MPESVIPVVSVTLAEDHQFFTEGLESLINNTEGCEVAAKIISKADNVKVLKQIINRLNPEVLLLDANMPKPFGISAAEINNMHNCTVKVVLVSMGYAVDAKKLKPLYNIDCLMVKATYAPALINALSSAAQNGDILPAQPIQRGRVPKVGATKKSSLNKTELGIIPLIAKGYTNEEIAKQRGVLPKTIEARIANIMLKLGVENTIQIAVFAAKHGLL